MIASLRLSGIHIKQSQPSFPCYNYVLHVMVCMCVYNYVLHVVCLYVCIYVYMHILCYIVLYVYTFLASNVYDSMYSRASVFQTVLGYKSE